MRLDYRSNKSLIIFMERIWNLNDRVRATEQVLVKENNLRRHSFNQSNPLFISRTDSMNLQSQDILLSMKPKASKIKLFKYTSPSS